jgi:two-component system response regulator
MPSLTYLKPTPHVSFDRPMLPILIVDDSQEDLMLAERVLRGCKLLNPVTSFTNGAECIHHFAEKKNGEPALVFLDLGMAPIGGLEVLRQVRDLDCAEGSIFVMLSGITDIKLLREGYQLGARTFLVKPLKVEDVVEFLGTVKDKIQVENSAEGYLLHWISQPANRAEWSAERKDTGRILSVRE